MFKRSTTILLDALMLAATFCATAIGVNVAIETYAYVKYTLPMVAQLVGAPV